MDKGLQFWTRRAEDNARAILAKQDDEAFWGDEYDPDASQQTIRDQEEARSEMVLRLMRRKPEYPG